jgi:hypothetical protein
MGVDVSQSAISRWSNTAHRPSVQSTSTSPLRSGVRREEIDHRIDESAQAAEDLVAVGVLHDLVGADDALVDQDTGPSSGPWSRR